MDKLIIRGGKSLNGNVRVEGAKNSILCLIAACLLGNNNIYSFSNVPFLSDTMWTLKILNHIGCKIQCIKREKTIIIDNRCVSGWSIPVDMSSALRASILFMAPLLTKFGKVKLGFPGGCLIGKRPINLHIEALEEMGVSFIFNQDTIEAYIKNDDQRLVGIDIDIKDSVGASEQIIIAATMAKGTTIIRNCSRDPEVIDMIYFLIKMGANISWEDISTVKIVGVETLLHHDNNILEHELIPDRMETGTFMMAAAVTKGNIFIENAVYNHNETVISHLQQMGVSIVQEGKGIRVIGNDYILPLNISTKAYPGFPTDVQQPMTIVQLMAQGTSVMKETLFEDRFTHMEELKQLNAQYSVSQDGKELSIYGPIKLNHCGAHMKGKDLRGTTALILCSLLCHGVSSISNLEYLDRGYYQFHRKLKSLGADIERIKVVSE